MDNDEVNKALERFITHVVNQSKRALTLKSKNKTKSLHKSIKGESKVMPNSLTASFFMNDYGKFIDRGVKGVGGLKSDGSSWKTKRVTRNRLGGGSPYRFTNKQPPTSAFTTDKINRPIGLSQRFATAKTVYHQGIETTEFFSRPFEAAFKKLPDELVEAYGLDIEEFLEFTLNEKI